MIKTLEYTHYHLSEIKQNLYNLNKQGTPVDYEIKIDGITVISRTKDLRKFFWHTNLITGTTKEVCIKLYKGKSRRYDKYLLTRQGPISPDPNMTTQEYIDSKVKEALDLRKQQMELAELRQRSKSQKKTIKRLRITIDELQSRKNGDINAVLELVKSQFTSQAFSESNKNVNGVPSDDLAKMIDHYRTQFGEETFSEALGIALQVAQHPTIIPAVKEFINDKISKNESKKA